MENTGYRKLDVDQFDPEQYQDVDDPDTPSLGPDERQVNQFLQGARLDDALKAALHNPPLKTKNQAVKDKATATVVRVLTSFKQAEMESALKKLSEDEAELLMKYIYKGMDILADGPTCQSLLAWHAVVMSRCGFGAIVRVLSDRARL